MIVDVVVCVGVLKVMVSCVLSGWGYVFEDIRNCVEDVVCDLLYVVYFFVMSLVMGCI